MFIEIENLKPEPLHVRHTYAVGDLNFKHADASLSAPVAADFLLTHKDLDLHLEGTVDTAIRHQCARCLCEGTYPVAARFDLYYFPQPESGGPDEEIELRKEDLEVGFYDGLRLDVDLVVLEQIELSLPMKFLCRVDCKGLCPECGANLNDGKCDCKKEAADPRLAVLLEFKKRMEDR